MNVLENRVFALFLCGTQSCLLLHLQKAAGRKQFELFPVSVGDSRQLSAVWFPAVLKGETTTASGHTIVTAVCFYIVTFFLSVEEKYVWLLTPEFFRVTKISVQIHILLVLMVFSISRLPPPPELRHDVWWIQILVSGSLVGVTDALLRHGEANRRSWRLD